MPPPPFPQGGNDASATSASTSSTSSPTSTTTATPTSTTSGGTPASATLLFGFLVIFVALFSAFLLLCFLWQYQRRRRALQAGTLLEFDENGRSYGHGYGGVPKLWEVRIQDEPSHWEWEEIRPLSVDVDHTTSSRQAITAISTRTRPRLSWLRNPFRRRPGPSLQPQQQQEPATPSRPPSPPEAQQQQRQPDGTGTTEAPSALIGGVRMSFVIAMPYADAPNRRRSAISQVSSMGENWRRRDYAIGIYYHPPFREG